MDIDLDLNHRPEKPPRSDFGIGAVGAGFIMRDVQLKAYTAAAYNVVAITSRTPEIAREVADIHGIPRVYDTIGEMLQDPAVEILDIAVPPDRRQLQPAFEGDFGAETSGPELSRCCRNRPLMR